VFRRRCACTTLINSVACAYPAERVAAGQVRCQVWLGRSGRCRSSRCVAVVLDVVGGASDLPDRVDQVPDQGCSVLLGRWRNTGLSDVHRSVGEDGEAVIAGGHGDCVRGDGLYVSPGWRRTDRARVEQVEGEEKSKVTLRGRAVVEAVTTVRVEAPGGGRGPFARAARPTVRGASRFVTGRS
jgi:hypothetical protein